MRPQINLQLVDIVLVKDQELFQWSWPLATVEEVHHGRDGFVCAVTIRTSKGSYCRPVHKLVPLLREDTDSVVAREDIQASSIPSVEEPGVLLA